MAAKLEGEPEPVRAVRTAYGLDGHGVLYQSLIDSKGRLWMRTRDKTTISRWTDWVRVELPEEPSDG